MGRPPCGDKVGVKKGPWTPEEDIILVSYIQQHGPSNWRTVPTNTGLQRCSKSCRLRWTNYLRPGIKRGNFTDHEEKMIIHLQALLGNRWAAISSYLPQRTDNDIKNYWNTHLKKKLRKESSIQQQPIPRGQWEKRLQTDIHMAKQALSEALSIDVPHDNAPSDSNPSNGGDYSYTKPVQPCFYASSTENISRLLGNWTKSSPNIAKDDPDAHAGTYHPNSGFSVDESKPLAMLEKWLFEEGSVQVKGEGNCEFSSNGNAHEVGSSFWGYEWGSVTAS